MSPSELKKLAKACRAAGISYFKNSDVEFTLDAAKPRKASKSTPKQQIGDLTSVIEEGFEAEGLSQDELLMWSTTQEDKSS